MKRYTIFILGLVLSFASSVTAGVRDCSPSSSYGNLSIFFSNNFPHQLSQTYFINFAFFLHLGRYLKDSGVGILKYDPSNPKCVLCNSGIIEPVFCQGNPSKRSMRKRQKDIDYDDYDDFV